MNEFQVRAITPEDRGWLAGFLEQQWGSPQMVYRDQVYHCDQLPGFVALYREETAGLVTYTETGDGWQIVSLDSLREGMGIGSALMLAVERAAAQNGIKRIWLLTTNDNLNALRFYQKRGYELVAVRRNAVEQARRLKPSIPVMGTDGIPLRDEIELEKPLKLE
ncbi:GNAT family N-acetyltransferase [Brevibacillus borstelensis]|uniref:GNAT family N-acetyltransferase n=1 Tax=Brevibacillus borstelensis TaxID=45462 RepID=UPI00068DDC13|nr:GNAT family N-acetyltransferase [Brevibacillus borstelensis]